LTSLGFDGGFDPNKISPVLKEQMSDRLMYHIYGIINKVRG